MFARQQVATALKFELAAFYMISAVAVIFGVDESTVKRWKRSGKLAYVVWGDRGIRFTGTQLADFVLQGRRSAPWDGVERRKVAR